VPVDTAMSRSGSSASTIRERLKPIVRPRWITSRVMTTWRTSRAASRISYDITTGAGTHSSSFQYGSGHAMHSGAAMMPPVLLRMS
jgi:hypothetical protein